MTLKECYIAMEGDYENVISRFNNIENILKKFLLKFLNDNSYENFHKSLKDKDYKEMFRAVHTIKGISQNLGFTKLIQSSSNLTEALRDVHNLPMDIDSLILQLDKDYNQTIMAIEEFKADNNA